MDTSIIFWIIILLFSAILHEVFHGYAAEYLGDPTARHQGRLTLNPLVHLDLWGSVILPLLLVFSGTGFWFAYAKPVMVNIDNLRNRRWGSLIVSAAGPFANILLVLVFSAGLRLAPVFGLGYESPAATIFAYIVIINMSLAIFNLIPIPPLDGSKILFALFPRQEHILHFLEQFGFIFVIIFAWFLWPICAPAVDALFRLLTGVSF